MRVGDLLLRNAGSKAFIKQGNTAISYYDWIRQSRDVADCLRGITSKESMAVAIFLPNSIEYAVAYFAILFADKVIVPIGIYAKKSEFVSTIAYCEVDLVITDAVHAGIVREYLAQYDYRINMMLVDTKEVVSFQVEKEYIVKSGGLKCSGSEDDTAIMLHTSGTTRNPKRVMLTHKNLICNVESNIESLQLTSNDKVLIALPMFFGYCNTAQFLTHVCLGASIVIMDQIFLPKDFFCLVESEYITNFTGVPPMMLMLLEYGYPDRHDFRSLRYICFGGGKMPSDKLKLLIRKYPDIGFVQTYGQTECSPRVTALLPGDALRKAGSVGKAIPGVEVKVLRNNEQEAGWNEVGEIVVQGGNVMKGYYKKPELTAEVLKGGWLHTGDLGYLDEDGFLYIKGRMKNMIISGGINIYPEEIEQMLMQHEKVADALVFGEDHGMMGEVPVAKIIVNSTTSELELRQYCREQLASYKIPVRFEFVDSLPKTYNGKNRREQG